MRKIIAGIMAFIMTTSISVSASASTIGKKDNVKENVYVLDGKTIKISKDYNKNQVTTIVDNVIKEIQSFEEYDKEVSSYLEQKNGSNQDKKRVRRNVVDDIEPGDGSYWVEVEGEEDKNIYKVSSNSSHFIQVIQWGYESTYGVEWKIAKYQGSNIGYLGDFKKAYHEWENAKNDYLTAGGVTFGLAGVQVLAGVIAGEALAKVLDKMGIPGTASVLVSAKKMMNAAKKMRSALSSVKADFSGKRTFQN